MTNPPLLESLREAAWNLEDFVAEVNRWLTTILPSEYGDARQREDFSVRLLRHYSSLGLLDEAAKVGREARYHYRHLLQVLCLRQLQRQGWNSKAIGAFCQNDNAKLEEFLQPDVQSESRLEEKASPARKKSMAPPNSALEFLRDLRAKRDAPPTPSAPASQRWKRLEIASGLELHILEHLHLSATERQRIQQLIEIVLQKETEK